MAVEKKVSHKQRKDHVCAHVPFERLRGELVPSAQEQEQR